MPEDRIGLLLKNLYSLVNRNYRKAASLPPKAKRVSRHKHWRPVFISGNGYGNTHITFQPFIIIPTGKIGLVLARDGAELETGRILARKVDCDSYQDAEAFLRKWRTKRAPDSYIAPGSYRINTFLFELEMTDMTMIPDNAVGVVTTAEGKPLEEGQIAGKDH